MIWQTSLEEENHEQKKARSVWGPVLLILLSVLLLTVCLTSYCVRAYDAIFPNIYVGEVNIGGMTAEEAMDALNDVYHTEKIRGIRISMQCKESKETLSLDTLGVSYRNQEAVGNALEESTYNNLFVKGIMYLRHRIYRSQSEPIVEYQKEALMAQIDHLVKPYEIEPVGYTFQIEPDEVVLCGKINGIKVDREAVVAEVERQIKSQSFQDIITEPQTIEPEPLVFQDFYQWLTGKAENAYYEKNEEGKVIVHRGKLQCSVDEETVKKAIREVDAAEGNTVRFPVVTAKPEITEEMLQEQLYRDVLGSYTTYYGGTAARANNVRLATGRINGYELLPGEEFSYDQTILPRNAQNGYQAAPVYVGNKVESGMGGGICQPSSTLYCAALYANLKIIERHPHSMQVSYLPPGLDATIAEGYLDLKFQNSTPYPIRLDAEAEGGKLTFTVRGYNPDQISVELIRSGGGYAYDVTRVIKKGGAEIGREKMQSSRYQPPAPSETPKPTEKKTEPKAEAPKPTENVKPKETVPPTASVETETAPVTPSVPSTPSTPTDEAAAAE